MSPSNLFIQQIELYPCSIPLKEPFIISLGALDHAELVIVVIRTNTGIAGFGECSPFKTIHGETSETGLAVGQYLAKFLINKNPLEIETCGVLMDQLMYGNTSIKSAFDMALHDIAAQQANVPLYKFLGGTNNKKIYTDYTVSLGEPEKMARDAIKIKNTGFTVIKVKLGESAERDIQRVKLIREAIGNEIPIRIDANQGWKTKVAIETLNALSHFGIEHCEEPIARWNFLELPLVRKNSPIKIMADESCCDHHDASRLIELKACDSFNIKLGKSSGILNAIKIIRLAEQAGMKIQIGGFLESRLGFTAAAHLSLCSDKIEFYDFDTPLMFSQDPVSRGIRYEKNGLVIVPEEPGLGAFYPSSFLDKLPVKVVN